MDKREDILEAALELFAERGFHGTSVALIAEKAQVGAGTIYRYFKSKEVLVNFLYQHWKREMSESILAGLDKGLAPRRLFHEIWSRMVAFSRKHPKELMFLEFHHHAPYLDDESRRLCNLLLGEFRQFSSAPLMPQKRPSCRARSSPHRKMRLWSKSCAGRPSGAKRKGQKFFDWMRNDRSFLSMKSLTLERRKTHDQTSGERKTIRR
jgi:AcrR family transcriptional regulator